MGIGGIWEAMRLTPEEAALRAACGGR
jgi:hypothetical protein